MQRMGRPPSSASMKCEEVFVRLRLSAGRTHGYGAYQRKEHHVVNQWTRNTLILTAMAFAVAMLPWYPVVAVYWLVIAFWLTAGDWEANRRGRSRSEYSVNCV